jgi:hypothetical protein
VGVGVSTLAESPTPQALPEPSNRQNASVHKALEARISLLEMPD